MIRRQRHPLPCQPRSTVCLVLGCAGHDPPLVSSSTGHNLPSLDLQPDSSFSALSHWPPIAIGLVIVGYRPCHRPRAQSVASLAIGLVLNQPQSAAGLVLATISRWPHPLPHRSWSVVDPVLCRTNNPPLALSETLPATIRRRPRKRSDIWSRLWLSRIRSSHELPSALSAMQSAPMGPAISSHRPDCWPRDQR
jgi:hypothetical protein